jgi:hypothetical protein
VAEVTEEGRVDIIGIGSAESKGIRKGVVINLDQTVDSIKRVVEEAELLELRSALAAGGALEDQLLDLRRRGLLDLPVELTLRARLAAALAS